MNKARFVVLPVILGLCVVAIIALQGRLSSTQSAAAASSQKPSPDGIWSPIEPHELSQRMAPDLPVSALTVRLEAEKLSRVLSTAMRETGDSLSLSQTFLSLPLPNGEYVSFRVEESSVLDADATEKYQDIKSYRGLAVNDNTITMRADWTPQGFHAWILTPDRTYSIVPTSHNTTSEYATFDAGAAQTVTEADLQCFVKDSETSRRTPSVIGKLASVGPSRRNFRLAISTTWEYSNAYGRVGSSSTIAGTRASLNTWINGINAIYERDLNIRFTLVDTPNVWYCDENGYSASTDPYTTGNSPVALLDLIRPILRDNVGQANYDIGHVFGYVAPGNPAGGVAWLGVVCDNTNINGDSLGPAKGGGSTVFSGSLGNNGFLNVVAHEIGHQFDAAHSFNGTDGNCGGGNRMGDSGVEPGSGSTIMSYAGNCSTDNVATGSTLRFHAWSFGQIINYVTTNTCATTSSTGNNAPTVNGGNDYTIPRRTPFELTATGNDVDGDTLAYGWEQVDAGNTFSNPPYTDQNDGANSTRPLFRSYGPGSSPIRTFPLLTYILDNANTPPATINGLQTADALSYINRSLRFRVVARDGRGGATDDEVLLTVNAASGPFLVTSPNTATTWTGGNQQTVTWSVNGTNAAPINCANVRIRLSTDGGLTFPITVLASTPNDGSETIVVPAGNNTQTARLRVEAVGNIFFDISDTNFTLAPGTACNAITLSPPTVPNGEVGVAYSQTITASGGAPAYSYAISAGAAPAGLTLSSAGLLSGIPTTNGTSNFTVRATDASGCTGTRDYSITITTPITNLALNKTATQSTTALGGVAGRAVDGNTNGNWGNNSVTHTGGDAQAWWQVDLGSVSTINTINLWNRTDCCGNRLSNFYVFVSDVPFTSTNLATTLSQPGVTNYFTASQASATHTVTVNRTGRYVRVQLAGTNILSLAEVEIIGTAGASSGTNLALNKTATQSTTALGGVAGRAVDGNTNGNWGNNSVTHTGGDAQAWWQVDLGSVSTINTINLWNRTDCCGDRLSSFYVFVSDVPFTSTNLGTTLSQPGVTNYHTPGLAGSVLTIAVNRTGRYVRVQLAGTNILSLAEVEVIGVANSTNVALNKTATQSTTALGGVASRAVDGNTNGNWGNNSVTHSGGDPQSWWQVDLGNVSTISTINLWNRTDCCGDRLSNFYVFVSDVPFTSTNLATTLSQPGVTSYHTPGQASATQTVTINRTGRYVRVQLAGTNILSLAEVQVMGSN